MSTQHVTPTHQPVNRLAVRFALAHLKRLRKAHADYDEEVREWYASGPGRPRKMHTFIDGDDVWQENVGGQGYRFPACIHGTSLWTPYDNICGPCEDSLTLHQEALILGHRDAHEYLSRIGVLRYVHDHHVPTHIVEQIREWALEPAYASSPDRTVRRLP